MGPNVLNNINTVYLQKLQLFASDVFTHANYFIAILAAIQITWTIGWFVIKGNDLDSMVVTVLKQIIIIGFFYTLILSGGQWLPKIMNSFVILGSEGGGIQTLDPSSIFNQGLKLAKDVYNTGMDLGLITHTFGAIMSIVVACVIVFSYVLITADIIITLVSVYAVYSVSTLFFAFGVSSLTSPMAKALIQKVIALGLKLLGLYLIIGIGTSFAGNWHNYLKAASSTDDYYTSWLTVAGATLIFYLLTKNIPSLLASLAGAGSLMSHGGETAAMAMGIGVAAGKVAQHTRNAAHGGLNIARGAANAGTGATQTVYGASQSIVGAATLNPLLAANGARHMGTGIKKGAVGATQAVNGTATVATGRGTPTLDPKKLKVKTL